MRKIKVSDIEKELTGLSVNKKEDCIYCVHEKPLVFKSKNNDINEEYCLLHQINVCNSFNMGGTIVANTCDIDLAIFKKDGWNEGKHLLRLLLKELKPSIPNIEIKGNDLIIDGLFKIASYASINVGNNYIYTAVHISQNPNIELIKNICLKPMNKIPKGLSEYGLSTGEVLDIVLKIANEF